MNRARNFIQGRHLGELMEQEGFTSHTLTCYSRFFATFCRLLHMYENDGEFYCLLKSILYLFRKKRICLCFFIAFLMKSPNIFCLTSFEIFSS